MFHSVAFAFQQRSRPRQAEERIFSRPKDLLEPVLPNYLLPETVRDVVNWSGRYTRHEAAFFKGLGSKFHVRIHICACLYNGPWIDIPPTELDGPHLNWSFVNHSPYTVVVVSVTVVISFRVEVEVQPFR